MGCVLPAGHRAGAGAAGGDRRGRSARGRGGHRQQGVRLGPEGGRVRRATRSPRGEHDIVVAGGMESMTNAPYLLPKARDGYRLGHAQVIDSMINDGLWDAYKNVHMGDCAELCAKEKGDHARRSGRLRGRVVPARAARAGRGQVQRRDRPGRDRAAQGPAGGGRRRRGAGARRHREAGRAAARVPEGRHGHGGQRFVDQRRRGGAGAGERRRRGSARLEAAGAHRRRRRDTPRRPSGSPPRPRGRSSGCWRASAGRRTTSTSGRSTRRSRSCRSRTTACWGSTRRA